MSMIAGIQKPIGIWEHMKTNKIIKTLFIIFITMFVSGILVGLIGRALCIRNNSDYQTLLPEIYVIEEIATVLQDDDGDIYVCYNDASCVNVYDQEGNFMWAVSVPYLRNSYFDLNEKELIVYNDNDAYIYNIKNRAFVNKESSDDLNLSFDYENTGVSLDEIETGDVFFDTYNVYKMGADGSPKTLIKRPEWYYIFHFQYDWLFSFIGAFSAGILLMITKAEAYHKIRQTDKIIIENGKVRRLLKYIKIMVAINIVYLVLNFAGGLIFGGILCIGIVPVALHFIIGNIIVLNMKDKHNNEALEFWSNCNWASFICAFLSVFIVAVLSN